MSEQYDTSPQYIATVTQAWADGEKLEWCNLTMEKPMGVFYARNRFAPLDWKYHYYRIAKPEPKKVPLKLWKGLYTGNMKFSATIAPISMDNWRAVPYTIENGQIMIEVDSNE